MVLVAGSNASMSAKLRRPARTPTTAKPSRSAAVHASRRDLGLQMLTFGAGLLGFAGAAFATDEGASKPAGDSTASSSSSSSSGGFITITPINGAAKSYMDMRDNAMEFQCSGGMFDCDGDRREFAHKQYMDWLNSGGVPKRIREGKPEGPKSY